MLFGCSAPGSTEPAPDAGQPAAPAEVTEPAPAEGQASQEQPMLIITANGTSFSATLEDNSSAEALAALLQDGPLTLSLHDYGNFEKVGPLGTSLPTNDEQIVTQPGDVILYQGSQITIYYDTNSWSFTRLAHIDGVTREDLLAVLGEGDVEVTFSLG